MQKMQEMFTKYLEELKYTFHVEKQNKQAHKKPCSQSTINSPDEGRLI